MDKVDWNTAPKDAQFYSCEYFRKHEDDKEFCWVVSIWHKDRFDPLEWHEKRYDFEMRPEVVEWDGKSALKAGDKAMTSGGECIVLGIDLSKGQAAVQWLDNGELGVILIGCIKPIPTERDKWVNAAINEILNRCGHFALEEVFIDTLPVIYDAMRSGKLKNP